MRAQLSHINYRNSLEKAESDRSTVDETFQKKFFDSFSKHEEHKPNGQKKNPIRTVDMAEPVRKYLV